jgi:hypothetical protein
VKNQRNLSIICEPYGKSALIKSEDSIPNKGKNALFKTSRITERAAKIADIIAADDKKEIFMFLRVFPKIKRLLYING